MANAENTSGNNKFGFNMPNFDMNAVSDSYKKKSRDGFFNE